MSEEIEQQLMRAWHDLGSPLRAIRLLVDLTESGSEPLGPQTRQHLKLITSRAQRAERLIDQLLEYLMPGVRPEPRTAVDTREVVHEAARELASGDFDTEITGDWPVAQLPAKAFSAAVAELLTNAVKHYGERDSGQRGRVVVDSTLQPGQLQVLVRDEGKGIEPRFHDTVFEFCKTLQSQDQIEGNGMGLTLIRRVLGHYGGQIQIASEPGQGTAVTMVWALPVAAPEPASA